MNPRVHSNGRALALMVTLGLFDAVGCDSYACPAMVPDAVAVRVLGAGVPEPDGGTATAYCTVTARVADLSDKGSPPVGLACSVEGADCLCIGGLGFPGSTYLVEVFRDGERISSQQATLGAAGCNPDGSCCLGRTENMTVTPDR